MKKLTRKSLDELAKVMPVISEDEQRCYVGGTDSYYYYGTGYYGDTGYFGDTGYYAAAGIPMAASTGLPATTAMRCTTPKAGIAMAIMPERYTRERSMRLCESAGHGAEV